jgi:hypothetical protein
MSTVVWTMAATGVSAATKTLAAWSIKNATTNFRSLDNDTFSFTIEEDVFNPPIFNFGDKITLYRNAVCWFQGTITKRVPTGSSRLSEVRYISSGPWYQLSRLIVQVPTAGYIPNGGIGTVCGFTTFPLTSIVLYQDPVTGLAISTGQQIFNAILYATEKGVALVPGTTPPFVFVTFLQVEAMTVADIIRRAMQWTPDGVTWFDYTLGVPEFNAQERALLAGVTLDLTPATTTITAFELVPRDDMVPTGVRFNYVGIGNCNANIPPGCYDPTSGLQNTGSSPIAAQSPSQVMTVLQDAAGNPDIPGGLVGTMALTQLTGTTTEVAPIGLAASYYASLQTVFWDGQVTTREQECTGVLRPGKLLNLTNGNSSWATMNAQIQQVSENLFTGETTAVLGLPGHLMIQDFVTLINITRNRPFTQSGLAAVNTPGTGGANCSAGLDPASNAFLNKLDSNKNAAGNAVTSNNTAGGAGPFSGFPATYCGSDGPQSVNALVKN